MVLTCPACKGNDCEIFKDWQSNERMEHLFDDHITADHIDFWSKAVAHSCDSVSKSTFLFDPKELQKFWMRGQLVPLALPHVLQILHDRKIVCPVSALKGQGMASWLFSNVVIKPVSWMWKQIIDSDGHVSEPALVNEPYVHIETLKSIGLILETKLDNGVFFLDSKPADKRSFYALIEKSMEDNVEQLRTLQKVNSEELHVLCDWLVKNSKAAVLVDNEEVIVQIGTKEVNVADVARVRLTVTSDQLNSRIDSLNEGIKSLRITAVERKRAGLKASAFAALKRMKAADSEVAQLESHVSNISMILMKMDTAKDQGSILASLELGNSALKQLHDSGDLSVDRIDNAMNALHMEVERSEDIGAALTEDLAGNDEDASLLAEFEELTKEEDAKKLIESMPIIENELTADPVLKAKFSDTSSFTTKTDLA